MRRIAIAVAAVLLIGAGVAAAQTAGFGDVPEDHLFAQEIEWMRDMDITRGCNPPANSKFCPEQFVTRGQMSAFFYRFAHNEALRGPAGPQGPKGDQGEQGIPGPQGLTGEPGEQGPKGDPGTNGIDGKDYCALVELDLDACGESLRGPQGEKGDRGEKGEPGQDGADGRDGVSGYHVRNVTIGVDDGVFRGIQASDGALTFQVMCKGDAVALGGGVTPENPGDHRLMTHSDGPVYTQLPGGAHGANGWKATVSMPHPGTVSGLVWVICAEITEG